MVSAPSDGPRVSFVCRSCRGAHLAPVIDLGETPLANALRDSAAPDASEPRYPLKAVFCRDCSLVQITETVPPDILFSHYLYFTSFSDTAIAAARALAARLIGERHLSASSLVLEAASNDGYLLRHYRDGGIPVLGIEPAENVAAAANRNGVPTRCLFFGRDTAAALAAEGLRCDVFHANNVLAHVADLDGFVAGIATVLKPDGVAVIEVPYLRDLIDKVEFDTIYHEHLCYFSATALDTLFARHRLTLADVERIPIHGGSLRLTVAHAGAPRSPNVAGILAEERRIGMTEFDYYAGFAVRVASLRRALRDLLFELKRGGHAIAAYGASAKGATLLNTFGIGRDLIDYVVDRSTVKQGRLTPGTHLPIAAPEVLCERQPDYVLLLSWNFADEILQQQSRYRAAGGRFILPVPEVRIV
jgi:SAM-dependent methyltransferase